MPRPKKPRSMGAILLAGELEKRGAKKRFAERAGIELTVLCHIIACRLLPNEQLAKRFEKETEGRVPAATWKLARTYTWAAGKDVRWSEE